MEPALAKSPTVAPALSPTVQPVGPGPTTPGFSLDGFLGMDAASSAIKVHLPDLGTVFKQTIAGAIDAAAPQVGTALEIEATLRCPIFEGVFMTGTPSIKVSRSATGLTATLGGGMGLSVGGGGLFADLLATASIQGEGADSMRVAEMLALAVEQYVRAVPNFVFVPFGRNLAIGALLALAAAAGVSIGDYVANLIWGGGHAELVISAMRDGEAAQITAGGTVGGSFDVDGGGKSIDINGSLAFGVEGQSRTEKAAGSAATTTKSTAFVNADELQLGPVSGGVDIRLPLEPGGGGTFTVTGKGAADVALLGSLEPYVKFIAAGIGKAQSFLAAAPASATTATGPVSASLNAAREVLPSVVTGASTMILTELRKTGADVTAGLEVCVEGDFAKRTGTVKFAVVIEAAQELGPGNEVSGAQKLQLGELAYTIPK